ncbi:pI215L [African swine fever virus]|uniref:PI215L n=1 Tax=African swine fever virus TaxID=10497 RepID=A0A8A1UGJ6_ASF|nr:pI215L [African swine fever virus]
MLIIHLFILLLFFILIIIRYDICVILHFFTFIFICITGYWWNIGCSIFTIFYVFWCTLIYCFFVSPFIFHGICFQILFMHKSTVPFCCIHICWRIRIWLIVQCNYTTKNGINLLYRRPSHSLFFSIVSVYDTDTYSSIRVYVTMPHFRGVCYSGWFIWVFWRKADLCLVYASLIQSVSWALYDVIPFSHIILIHCDFAILRGILCQVSVLCHYKPGN